MEMMVGRRSSDSPWVSEIPADPALSTSSLRHRLLHRTGVNLDIQSLFPSIIEPSRFATFDAVHLHDLPAWNWCHFRWLAKQVPLFWTIHSMAPFTGNCLYSYNCDRYQRMCGSCPQHGKWPLLWNHRDGSRLNLGLKRWFTRGVSLNLIGVSDWISERCRESSLFRQMPITTIQNAVSPERFYRVDPVAARDRVGIPQDAKAVLVSVAGNPLDSRKGIDLSIEALRQLGDSDLFLLPMGISGESSELKEAFGQFSSLPSRHISDDAVMRDYYSAADVVWHPSRADTSSMVSLEAFACGTPVIAAEVGGVPEVVRDGKGLLISADDSTALAAATRRFFEDPEIKKRAQTALAGYSVNGAFERILDEYEVVYSQAAWKPQLNKR